METAEKDSGFQLTRRDFLKLGSAAFAIGALSQAGAAEQSLVTRTETLRSGAQDLLERVNALDAASAQQADEIAILRRSVDGAIGRLNRQVEYLHSIGGRQLQQWEVLMEVVRTLNKL